MSNLNNLKYRFFRPALTDTPFLLLVWLIFTFPEFMVQISKGNYYASILYVFLYFGLAYLSVLVIDWNQKLAKWLKPIFFFFLSIITIANIYCLYTYRTRLTYNFIEIIGGTNADEAKEYFQMYLNWSQYLLLAFAFIFCWILYIFVNRIKTLRIPNAFIISLIICSIISFFINPTLKQEFVTWSFNFEDIVDLRKYSSNPKIKQEIDTLPQYVVVIIGESHAKSHSSLYGYEKKTNPLLEQKTLEGNLLVFNNVESPKTNTSGAFKYILNTHTLKSPKEEKWYKSINLVDVLKEAGYKTYWLSNQAQKGLYNNLSSSSALLCDSAVFIREYWNDKKYDADLSEIKTETDEKQVSVFYHLMGQHIMFNERYPSNFEFFIPEDYSDISTDYSKRLNLASYDNATLYNDYTINKIIDKYKDKDAIIYYFSDHGLDVYASDYNYCGHAMDTENSQKIGRQIPFLVYFSPLYLQRRPERVDKIKSKVERNFTTDEFIYEVLEGVGLQLMEK